MKNPNDLSLRRMLFVVYMLNHGVVVLFLAIFFPFFFVQANIRESVGLQDLQGMGQECGHDADANRYLCIRHW